ncbi:MAG: hypothetical protein EP330_23085 [Deltaproteobacteria bacterium]|nr:MAG: hypothetical protein EP330_23085 [Deltaproteobacteria bacterium]
MPSGYIPGALGLALFVVLVAAAKLAGGKVRDNWEHGIGLYGLGLFLWGQYSGLFVAPREAMMGDVGRILYVHVPAAWISMMAFTWAFAGSFGSLMLQAPQQLPKILGATGAGGALGIAAAVALDGTPRKLAAFFGVLLVLAFLECLVLYLGHRFFGWDADSADHFAESSTETGIVLGLLLLFLGAVFAKPTWGTYWTWDPRLTASAIMVLTFVGVSLLRATVSDPDTRRSWVSVATVIAYINIPITYMAVKWWRTMHQLQSTPNTLDSDMTFWLRVNAWAFLFLAMWFVARGWRIAAARAAAEAPPPLPPAREVAR